MTNTTTPIPAHLQTALDALGPTDRHILSRADEAYTSVLFANGYRVEQLNKLTHADGSPSFAVHPRVEQTQAGSVHYDGADQKITMIRPGMMGGITVQRARLRSIEVGEYAQYSAGVHVTYRGKGKRKDRKFCETYAPQTVILAGWVDAANVDWLGESCTLPSGMVVRQSRYSGCDLEGQAADIEASLASVPDAVVLFDFRGHNAYHAPFVSQVGRQCSERTAEEVLSF